MVQLEINDSKGVPRTAEKNIVINLTELNLILEWLNLRKREKIMRYDAETDLYTFK